MKPNIRTLLIMILLLTSAPIAQAKDDLLHADPALLRLAEEHPDEKIRIIIQRMANINGNATPEIDQIATSEKKELPIINGVALEVPASAINGLARSPNVRWISFDAPMRSATSTPGFSEQGIIKTPIRNSAAAYATALQTDGKVLIAGSVNNDGKGMITVARRNSNGDPDDTFGSKGFVMTAVGSYEMRGLALAVQADGKILAAGHTYNGKDWDFALLRYNSNGSLDSSFANAGRQTTDISGTDAVSQIVVQSDGKIIVAGREGSNLVTLVRYNSNGSLDSSFGSAGKLVTTLTLGHGYGDPIALQSDGKIVVTGTNDYGNNRWYDIAVARYYANGSLDTSFGSSGYAVTSLGSGADRGNAVKVQSDGKIVVAGIGYNGNNFDIALVRYSNSGRLDTTFHGDGISTTQVKGDDYGHVIAIQSDGKILVGGVAYGEKAEMALLRFQSNGYLDTTFATNGIATADNGGVGNYAYDMALQSDGKILLAGYVDVDYYTYNFAALRFTGSGKLDVPVSPFAQTTGSTRLQSELPTLQGQGVTVAVIDSGINNHVDLKVAGSNNSRILYSKDFTSVRNTNDSNGHGTFVAGIIGSNGSSLDGLRVGIAPKVNLLNLKISGDLGVAYMSDVLESLQWVYQNKSAYNIRVVNLSLNSTVPESYHVSPLSAATEILWFNGIVVVVAAGNNGTGSSAVPLLPPANDPFVVTVGAVDSMNTLDMSDDTVASFSAYGITEDGYSKPDLVAPGRNIVSLLASTTARSYTNHPANRVDNYVFRMSGTSASAPMVSGAVALLLQDEPTLTPDQVKYRLKATANKSWSGYSSNKAGAGYLDIYAAVKGNSTQSANTGIPVSYMLYTGADPVAWNSVNWNSVNWNSVNWNSVNWNSVNWNSTTGDSDIWESGIWDETTTPSELQPVEISPDGVTTDMALQASGGGLLQPLPSDNTDDKQEHTIFLPLVSR